MKIFAILKKEDEIGKQNAFQNFNLLKLAKPWMLPNVSTCIGQLMIDRPEQLKSAHQKATKRPLAPGSKILLTLGFSEISLSWAQFYQMIIPLSCGGETRLSEFVEVVVGRHYSLGIFNIWASVFLCCFSFVCYCSNLFATKPKRDENWDFCVEIAGRR